VVAARPTVTRCNALPIVSTCFRALQNSLMMKRLSYAASGKNFPIRLAFIFYDENIAA
jgi:hypothetical protein